MCIRDRAGRTVIAGGAVVGLIVGIILLLLGLAEDADAVALLPIDNTVISVIVHLVVAAVLGAIIAAVFECRPGGHASMVSNGVLTALLWWIIGPLRSPD